MAKDQPQKSETRAHTDAYFDSMREYTLARHDRMVQDSKDNSYKLSIKGAMLGAGIGVLWAFKKGSMAFGYVGYALAGAFIGSSLGGLVAIITDKQEKV